MADYRREDALKRRAIEVLTAWTDRHNHGGPRAIRTVLGVEPEELLSDADPDRELLAGLLLLSHRLAVELAECKNAGGEETSSTDELARLARWLEDR